jgi:hypothetical protein
LLIGYLYIHHLPDVFIIGDHAERPEKR